MSRTEPQQGHHRGVSLNKEPSKPSRNEDGFIVAEKRAEHWLGVWSGFWERQRSWL